MSTRYAPAVKRAAVDRAREIGTKKAARELRIDAKTIRAWRRADNHGLLDPPSTIEDLTAEIDALERRLANADLAEVVEIQSALKALVDQAGIRVSDHPDLQVFEAL